MTAIFDILRGAAGAAGDSEDLEEALDLVERLENFRSKEDIEAANVTSNVLVGWKGRSYIGIVEVIYFPRKSYLIVSNGARTQHAVSELARHFFGFQSPPSLRPQTGYGRDLCVALTDGLSDV